MAAGSLSAYAEMALGVNSPRSGGRNDVWWLSGTQIVHLKDICRPLSTVIVSFYSEKFSDFSLAIVRLSELDVTGCESG